MLNYRYLSQKPLFEFRGLSIRGYGIREVMRASAIERPRGTGDCLFMLFHDSSHVGKERVPVLPGTVILWSKGSPQYYGSTGKRWSHSWIHCDGSQVKRALQSAKVPIGRPLKPIDPYRFEKHLIGLHEELEGMLTPDPVIVANTVVNLIREAGRKPENSRRRKSTPGLERALEALNRRYDEPLALSDLSTLAGLSTSHFCVQFRECFGISPMAYLTEKRMRIAATLIGGTTEAIGEIGRKVGYPDPYYFSKHFKAICGVSPSGLRKGDSGSKPL